jgi:hypothetical protein
MPTACRARIGSEQGFDARVDWIVAHEGFTRTPEDLATLVLPRAIGRLRLRRWMQLITSYLQPADYRQRIANGRE